MAKQIINTGTSANSRDGDPLRIAMGKINDNFDELYVGPPQLTQVEIDEITPQSGQLVYNLTTEKFQGYTNSGWVDLH